MENNKLDLSIFDDLFVYKDYENKKIQLYILDKEKEEMLTIDEFASNKEGQKATNFDARHIYCGKLEIINKYKELLSKVEKKPRLTYKKRLKLVETKRDEEIEKYMLKYRYLTNSPKLDVVEVEDFYLDSDGMDSSLIYRMENCNLSDGFDLCKTKYIIAGEKNKFLIPVAKFFDSVVYGRTTCDYITNNKINSIEDLKQCEKDIHRSVFSHLYKTGEMVLKDDVENANKNKQDKETEQEI